MDEQYGRRRGMDEGWRRGGEDGRARSGSDRERRQDSDFVRGRQGSEDWGRVRRDAVGGSSWGPGGGDEWRSQRGYGGSGYEEGRQGGGYGAGTGSGAARGQEHASGRGFESWGSGPSQRGGGQAYGGMRGGAGRPPKGYKRSDDRIHEDVCERLMMSSIDASEVTVQVKDGHVSLEGTVPERWMKHAIEDTADGVAGVQDVDNRIRVQREGGIMSDIKSALGMEDADTSKGSSSSMGASAAGVRSAMSENRGGDAAEGSDESSSSNRR